MQNAVNIEAVHTRGATAACAWELFAEPTNVSALELQVGLALDSQWQQP
jgi:hypothetical protein